MIKRILKLIISLFYFLYDKFLYYLKKLFHIRIKPKCTALYYHSIFDDEVENFKKQVELISKKTTTIPSGFTGKLEDDKLYSILLFDDGYENLISNAIPYLEEKQLPYTIFFVTNYFGLKPDWERIEIYKDKTEKIMTSEQMNQINSNLLTIGSHTANHKMLHKLTDNEIDFELVKSKMVLENLTGKKVELLSFPNGQYNDDILKKSFEAGYKRVFTIEHKLALQNQDEKITGRIAVNSSDWYLEFWLKTHGAYSWIAEMSKTKLRLCRLFRKSNT